MRIILFLTVLIAIGINCFSAKNNVKALTESMGHEIIEIGAPVKGLPADLEEEPSAEVEDDEKGITTTTLAVATKKDTKKNPSPAPDRRKLNDLNKLDDDSKQDDEEEKIEKELAEIYKDNIDYKADSAEVVKEKTDVVEEKPIGRSRGFFKFQPDMSNKAEVEKFRTSVDEISCDKRATKLSYTVKPRGNSAFSITADYIFATFITFTTTVLSCRIL